MTPDRLQAPATGEDAPGLIRRFRLPYRGGLVTGYVSATTDGAGNVRGVFITLGKHGDALGSMARQWARAVSQALQHGTPLGDVVRANRGVRFEPCGFTGEPAGDGIHYAASVVDYVAQWLEMRYMGEEEGE